MALEEFTSGGHRDFRQRYQGVYGFFPTSDKEEILVRVSEVAENRMSFLDVRGIQYTAYADKGVFFRFIPVTKRLFLHEKSLVLATRKTARQYQRGITDANTLFQTVYGTPLEIDFDSINAYVKGRGANKTPSSVDGYLLNDFLAIYGSNVYLYNQVIGNVYDNKIILTSPLFRQEVIDAVRANGLTYEVIV